MQTPHHRRHPPRRRFLPTEDREAIRTRRRAARCCSTRPGNYSRKLGAYLGVATNNVAEWTALLLGLEAARSAAFGAWPFDWTPSSSSSNCAASTASSTRTCSRCTGGPRAAARFEHVDLRHVPRKQNVMADRLVNRVLDQEASAPAK